LLSLILSLALSLSLVPTFSHFLIVNEILSLSLSLARSLCISIQSYRIHLHHFPHIHLPPFPPSLTFNTSFRLHPNLCLFLPPNSSIAFCKYASTPSLDSTYYHNLTTFSPQSLIALLLPHSYPCFHCTTAVTHRPSSVGFRV
jgi:hypothetical protein